MAGLKKHLCLVLEYASGSALYQKLAQEGTFTECDAPKYVPWVAETLRYLHGESLMHRDIKPKNTFLDSNWKAKLAGSRHTAHAPSNDRSSLCGTLDLVPTA